MRVESELVQTDVMVFDKSGKFVDGLTREQFELTRGRPARAAGLLRARVGAPARRARPRRARSRPPPTRPSPRARAGAPSSSSSTTCTSRSTASTRRARPSRASSTRRWRRATSSPSSRPRGSSASSSSSPTTRRCCARPSRASGTSPRRCTTPSSRRCPSSSPPASPTATARRPASTSPRFRRASSPAPSPRPGGNPAINANAIYEMVKTRATNITKQMESVTNGSLSALEKLVNTAGADRGAQAHLLRLGRLLPRRQGLGLDGQPPPPTRHRHGRADGERHLHHRRARPLRALPRRVGVEGARPERLPRPLLGRRGQPRAGRARQPRGRDGRAVPQEPELLRPLGLARGGRDLELLPHRLEARGRGAEGRALQAASRWRSSGAPT